MDQRLSDIVAVMVSVSVDGPYSYKVPYGMSVTRGSIVAVPLVGRPTLGVVWGAPKDNFAHNRLKDIEHIYGVPPAVVEGREKAGALERLEVPAPPIALPPDPEAAPPTLSAEQRAALDQIQALDLHRFGVALLDGVTGGGKTEVFFEAVADTLRAGRQALILLPALALAPTFLERFTRRFGTRPAEWHSDMTPSQRARTWRGINDGTVRAVVGARSALFLPFHELGLIVLDEEHDGAYKQADGVNYHARDMAVVRAKCSRPSIAASRRCSSSTAVAMRR